MGAGKVRSMSNVERGLIALLLIAVTVVGSHIWGWHRGYAASEVVWLAKEAQWTAEKARIVAEADAQAQKLRAEGSTLAAALEKARSEVRIEYVEVIREIGKRTSSVRRAVDADLAGLLNSLSGIRETTTRVDPAGVVETRTETATDSGRPASAGVSERALAEWIANAVKSHEECRQQANSLIEYAKVCSR